MRSFRDYRCAWCESDINLTWYGRLGWCCIDTVRCYTLMLLRGLA